MPASTRSSSTSTKWRRRLAGKSSKWRGRPRPRSPCLNSQCYVDGFMERSKIQTTVEVPEDFDRLPPETEIAVFHAVQECLANVHRHSGSSSCSVKLVRDGHELQLQVEDSGSGLPKEKLPNVMSSGGVGLRGVRESVRRLGGTLAIDSSEQGTTVTIKLPIQPGKSASPEGAAQNEEVA